METLVFSHVLLRSTTLRPIHIKLKGAVKISRWLKVISRFIVTLQGQVPNVTWTKLCAFFIAMSVNTNNNYSFWAPLLLEIYVAAIHESEYLFAVKGGSMTSSPYCSCQIRRDELASGIQERPGIVKKSLYTVQKFTSGENDAEQLITKLSMLPLLIIFPEFPLIVIHPSVMFIEFLYSSHYSTFLLEYQPCWKNVILIYCKMSPSSVLSLLRRKHSLKRSKISEERSFWYG